MSKKTDKAYESILRAFESPNEKFDQLGDVDTGDIDKNFEKANPDPEGKSWSDWDKEKESDTASEDYLDDIDKDFEKKWDGVDEEEESDYEMNHINKNDETKNNLQLNIVDSINKLRKRNNGEKSTVSMV